MTEAFGILLEMSITGAVIIAAVMLIRLCMKRLPRRYAYFLWIIPAIRLIYPVSISSEVSLFNLFPPQSVQVEYSEQIVAEQTVELSETVIPQETAPSVTVYFPEQPTQPQTAVTEKQTTEEIAPQRSISAVFVVSLVWLAVVMAMLSYIAFSCVKTKRTVKSAVPLQDNIFICKGIETPFVFGLAKPKIYIPDGVMGTDLQHILAHENAHIKRCDYIVKMLAMVILSVHWFNPFVWLGFKLMTEDMELSCDEKALGSYDLEARKAYANTLLSMSIRQNKLSIGGMLSFGEIGIKTRIKGVLAMKKPKLIACIFAVAVIIIAAVCLLTNAERLVIEDGERASVTVGGIYAVYGDKTADLDPQEIAALLNSFNVKKISGADVYRPEEPTVYEIDIFTEDNVGYDQISFLSPICEQGDFKYIVVTRVRVRENEPNIETDGYYKLKDSDYDKLCKTIIPKFDSFIEGCYISEVDSNWKVYVEYENGKPWFDIKHYNNSMMKVFPDHTDTYGLVKTESLTGMTLRYFGNGVLNIEPTRTTSSFVGDFIWKGKAEDITEDDDVLQCNSTNTGLGSFVIEKTAIGYEAHSPLTDIYIKFTEDDNSLLFLCRERSSGANDEYIYDYRGGFNPYRTEIQLYDVTGDGTDDLILSTHFTGTGVVDNEMLIVDGKTMEKIPIYRIGAEKMIAEMSEELLEGEEFEVPAHYISANMPELEYEYIYPYYPDKSVRRYGGMVYGFDNGKLTSTATFMFIRNDSEYSEIHRAEFEYEYVDGTFMPVSAIKAEDIVEVTVSPFDAVVNYYNNKEIEITDKDIKIGQNNTVVTWQYKYPPLSEQFDIAEDSEIIGAIVDYTADGAAQSVVAVIESNQKFGFRVVDTFTYEPHTFTGIVLDVAKTDSDGSKQFYIVQPEGTSDEVRVYSFAMYGDYITGDAANSFKVGDKVEVQYNGTLEYGREGNNRVFSMKAVESSAASELENADIGDDKVLINLKSHSYISDVYKMDKYGYEKDYINPTQLEISFSIPQDWEMDYSVASLNGGKIFEIGVPYPAEQGINYDDLKIDYGEGREITVHEEKVGTADDPFVYFISTSADDFYSDDGSYDNYTYVVTSGGYNINMYFISDAGVGKAVFEQVVRSLKIEEIPSEEEPADIQTEEQLPTAEEADYIPDVDEVFHTAVNPEGTAYDIQFEKLAGTDDAKSLNKYKNEILTYINERISYCDNIIRPLRSSDIDFNNEELVQGVKIHGVYSDYSPDAEYDKVMSTLESESFIWKILVQNEYTGVYLSIRHCNSDECSKLCHFGDDWCVSFCDPSRATAKTYTTAADFYAKYAVAEEILNKYVKADKNDDIKVVYASIGHREHYYTSGGIVFVNGVAKYIYSDGFAVHNDRMKPETPEDIVQKMDFGDLYLVTSSRVGSTDYEGIFNYNEVMSVIKVYEKYALYDF